MVASITEGIQIVAILLRYMKKGEALKMLNDMDFEIAEFTDNESLKKSIKMVRDYLEWNRNILRIYGLRITKWSVN